MSLETLETQVKHFETLDNRDRIQALIELAQNASKLEPKQTDNWDLTEIRQDQECLDEMGLYLRRNKNTLELAATVGNEATTLTRALTAVLIKHLNGETPARILGLKVSFVPRLVGESLLRQRRNAAYYPLRRLQDAVRQLGQL